MLRTNVLRIADFNSPADNLNAAVNEFFNHCKARNLSVNTITYYTFRLQSFARYLQEHAETVSDPKDINAQVIRSFVTSEASHTSPATANHAITALRTFFGWLVRDGFLGSSPMDGVEKLRRKQTIIATFTMQQVEAVLTTCRKDFRGVRDRAMIMMLLDCGLRISELCGLTVDDISWTEQTMLVTGKGDKERVVPFGRNTRQALLTYTARRGDLSTKALFVTCYGDPLNRYRAREIIRDRCKAAHITGVRCSPHTFRHTFAVTYLRSGGDVFSLQKLLGHTDLTMTRRYAELSQSDVVGKHRQFSPGDRLQTKGAGARSGYGRRRRS